MNNPRWCTELWVSVYYYLYRLTKKIYFLSRTESILETLGVIKTINDLFD